MAIAHFPLALVVLSPIPTASSPTLTGLTFSPTNLACVGIIVIKPIVRIESLKKESEGISLIVHCFKLAEAFVLPFANSDATTNDRIVLFQIILKTQFIKTPLK